MQPETLAIPITMDAHARVEMPPQPAGNVQELAAASALTSTALHTPTPRMTFPDALRGLASLLVVLPHSVGVFAIFATPSLLTRAITYVSLCGVYGVQIFFVLSGFVIAYTLRTQRVTPRYVAVFALRRSVRLDPPYWCAVLLALAFVAMRWKLGKVDLPSVPEVLAHLFYLQQILGFDESLNVVFWTLCVELQLYLAFCIFTGLAQVVERRGGPSLAVVGSVLYIASLAWPAGLLPTSPEAAAWFPEWWYAFATGTLVWWAFDGRLRTRTVFLLLLPLVAIAIIRQIPSPAVTALTALSLLWCGRARGLYTWLNRRPLQLLGRWSYCLYLVHVPVAGVIIALLTRLAPHHEWPAYASLGCIYVGSLLLACLLHYAVEVPSLRWSQRLKSLHRVPPPVIEVS